MTQEIEEWVEGFSIVRIAFENKWVTKWCFCCIVIELGKMGLVRFKVFLVCILRNWIVEWVESLYLMRKKGIIKEHDCFVYGVRK